MAKLTQKQVKEIVHLRGLFPKEIAVRIGTSEDGGFYADVLKYPGCHTQGETFSELIDMINDCVYTYFEIPERYLSYMPSYIASTQLAEKFGLLPDMSEVRLKSIQQREAVKS